MGGGYASVWWIRDAETRWTISDTILRPHWIGGNRSVPVTGALRGANLQEPSVSAVDGSAS